MPDLVRQFEAETPEFLRPFVPRSSYTEKALNVMISKLVKEGQLSRKDWDYYDSLCDERVIQMGGRAVPRRKHYPPVKRPPLFSKSSGWQSMIAFLNASKTRLTTWWRGG